MRFKEAIEKLLSDVPGIYVMNEMRKTYKTLASLNKHMSLVRTSVIRGGHRSPLYDDSVLREYISEEGVSDFIASSLETQCFIKRAHTSTPVWSVGAEAALSSLRLLPDSLSSFHLSHAENLELKKKHEMAQVEKNSKVTVIGDAEGLLKAARRMLESASEHDSYASLAIPLLLVSGRRECEIFGTSTFEASNNGEMYAEFNGQAKKRGECRPYVIPLLVEFSVFRKGYDCLKQKQGETVKGFTSTQIGDRCSPLLHKGLKRTPLTQLRRLTVHALRSVYASYVYTLFDCPYTFSRTIMLTHGHETLPVSLSYCSIRLEDCDGLRGVFGVLKV